MSYQKKNLELSLTKSGSHHREHQNMRTLVTTEALSNSDFSHERPITYTIFFFLLLFAFV